MITFLREIFVLLSEKLREIIALMSETFRKVLFLNVFAHSAA